MLLAGRRQGLLHFCLVGMEIAWITPFATMLLHQHGLGWTPAMTFCRLLAAVLLWILTLELLNRWNVGSPLYQMIAAALLVISTLAVVRYWLHADAAIGDLSWLQTTFDALFNIQQGLRPELVLVLANLLLWQRAASATSRSLDFFNVGVSFRFGILLLILGGGLLMHVTGYDVTGLFWLYLGLGLMCVALARISDKLSSGGSLGKPMSRRGLAQLGAAVVMTVGGVAALSLAYTPTSIKTVAGWLRPLWTLLGMLAEPLAAVLLWLIEIIINGLYWILTRLMVGMRMEVLEELGQSLRELLTMFQRPSGTETLTLPPWLLTTLRYGGVLLALLVIVGMILLSLERLRARRRADEDEEELEEEITLGGGTLGRGWRWLRDRARLVRRFGVGRDLLAAISVQNMYANLCRLAGRRGFPRHPAQPPDRYLAILVQAFGGHQAALARITTAYMRVHYGDRPVTFGELARLRKDYDQVRTAEQADEA
jgi:hypothetical protein